MAQDLSSVSNGNPQANPSALGDLPDLKTISIFAGKSCGGCDDIEALLKTRKLAYKIYNIDDFAQYKMLVRLEEKLGREAKKLPALFWNDLMIEGKPEILKAIKESPVFVSQTGGIAASQSSPLINSGQSKPEKTLSPVAVNSTATAQSGDDAQQAQPSAAEAQVALKNEGNSAATLAASAPAADAAAQIIRERFVNMRILAVIMAGLLDGINPCAFATIVFLMGCLTTASFGTRNAVIMGLSFCLGVFITYFLVGAGACKALLAMQEVHSFRQWFHVGVLVVLGIMAAVFLVDSIHTWRNGGRPLLALSENTRLKINALMARGMHARNLVITGLLVGSAISLLELACTGQVYLPTIAVMTEDASLAGRAYMLLLVYNLMFILPLLCVFFLCLAGIKTVVFRNLLHKHAATAKLAAAVLFLGMIAVMW